MIWGYAESRNSRDLPGKVLAVAGLLAAGMVSVVVAGELQHRLMQTVIGLFLGIG